MHRRRHIATDLIVKIEAAGFQVLRSTSFVTVLLPAMIVSRFFKRKIEAEKAEEARAELAISPWLNSFFYGLLRIELAGIRMGLSFPVGGSRLVVARKI